MYRTDFWTQWEKARVGRSERIALKHIYYQVWNRSPVQLGCMRQLLWPGALGWPRGMGWGRRWEGGLGWETHVNPWLIHVNIWQKPLQYCKVISLQLIKINEKRKDPDAGKDWRQEEKGMTEDEMVGWHHRHDGHEFEQALGAGDGQGSLACCSPWDKKKLDMT